ncbi:uncharacterized protein LOC142348764 [Convolutriloba macropyga]|uniref:uncharacterized protein LOC142348764 n=1 Tax=Convolutriloba macropyga TaxID=536237 RepID=UPI003F51D029
MNDIALVRTHHPIVNWRHLTLPLCALQTMADKVGNVMLGAVGMGSTLLPEESPLFPDVLQEAPFVQVLLELNGSKLVKCRHDLICTSPLHPDSVISAMDDGGALFKFKCGSLEPECLYGVASFSSKAEQLASRRQSYFTNAVNFRLWIYNVIVSSRAEP